MKDTRRIIRWLLPLFGLILLADLVIGWYVLRAWRAPAPSPTLVPPIPTETAAATSTPSRSATPQSTPTAAPTSTFSPTPSPSPTPTPAEVILVGAGDIAVCGNYGAEATARLLERFPDAAIFTAGDNSNQLALPEQYRDCFDPTWGRFKKRIHPAPGNHDYLNPDAYHAYFGAAAGAPGQGYYSYELGAWHIIAVNSNCDLVDGCWAGSPQEIWLRADLAAHPAQCTLAYWHAPLFSSGYHGPYDAMRPIWQALSEAGAEVVVNGHDHQYERFAPQNPNGQLDEANGIRQFIAGTGGADKRYPPNWSANSQKIIAGVYGVLKFTLKSGSYDWEFIPEEGQDQTDSGSQNCH